MELTKERIIEHWGTTFEAIMDTLPTPESFDFQSIDNIKLKGKIFRKTENASCVMILSHGWTSNWAGMLKYFPALENCNCDLVLYDMRGHGESEGEYATGGIWEAKDIIALTDWLVKEKGFQKNQIGWFGASWGAAATLKAAEDEEVAFVIVDSPFQDWYSAIFERAIEEYGSKVNWVSSSVMNLVGFRAGVNYKEASPLKATQKTEMPILLIHSKTDSETSSTQSVNISKELRHPKSVFHHTEWGSDHTQDILLHKEKFRKLVDDFLINIDSRFVNQ